MSSEYQEFIKASKINFEKRVTVDNLLEATHYFAKSLNSEALRFNIGGVCESSIRLANIIERKKTISTDLGTIISKEYCYFVTYSKEYVKNGWVKFERVSSAKCSWLAVDRKVVDHASALNYSGPFKDACTVVVVTSDKRIWFIHPNLLKKFAFEYETESRIYYHIPIVKTKIVSEFDPFN